jgi:hypothetical protein
MEDKTDEEDGDSEEEEYDKPKLLNGKQVKAVGKDKALPVRTIPGAAAGKQSVAAAAKASKHEPAVQEKVPESDSSEEEEDEDGDSDEESEEDESSE